MNRSTKLPTQEKSSHAGAEFTIAPLNAHTWIVAYSRALLPGAVLRTKQAALDYVHALAESAALGKVRVRICDATGPRWRRPAHFDGTVGQSLS